MEEEDAVEVLQRYRRDRRVLVNIILSGSIMKKVVMPPGAVSLDDVDLDQVSVDFVLNCAKKEAEESSSLSKSQSLSSTQVQELTVDDIDEFDDDDDLEEVDSRRYSRRVLNDAADLALRLPSFTTVLLASAGASAASLCQ